MLKSAPKSWWIASEVRCSNASGRYRYGFPVTYLHSKITKRVNSWNTHFNKLNSHVHGPGHLS